MDIEAAYTELKGALAEISAYDEVLAVAKHPDVWILQAATMPIISLLFADGAFEHETGDHLWSEAVRSRVEFEVHLIITTSTDSLSQELMRQFKDIQDKVIELTLRDTAQFRYYVANFQTAYADNGKWGWAVMRVVAGP